MLKINFEDRFFQCERLVKNLVLKLSITYSRIRAHRERKQVVKKIGRSVINRQIKKSIKEYARQRFGRTNYWPYLALYTEIRGQFIKGWIPYDYFRYVFMPKINPQNYRDLSNIKTFDYRLFGEFAIRPLLVFISGIFYNTDLEIIEEGQVKKLLSDYDNTIVVKEEFGMKGKQINIIHSSEFIPGKLKKNINYIIQPYIKQYKVLNDLYPEGVNTFRVTTFLNTDGSVNIKCVILRFGVDGLKIDNLSSGGQYIYFDSSGKPSNLAYDYIGLKAGAKHKNTGYLFSDVRIPMFHKILDLCEEAHKKYPYLRLIGWDVCIDDSGEPKLIEWNAFCPSILPEDINFGPFWTDDSEINLKLGVH